MVLVGGVFLWQTRNLVVLENQKTLESEDKDSIIQPNQTCIEEWRAKNLKSGTDFRAGDLLIKFKEDITENESRDIIKSYDLEWSEYLGNIRWILIRVPKNKEFEWICKLQGNIRVEYVELNFLRSLIN